MDIYQITLEQVPKRMITVGVLREAFDMCTPYDCPSRVLFSRCYPERNWPGETPEDVSMEMVVKVFWYCMGHTAYLDRFIGFFAGHRVASYDVLNEYFVRALVKT